MLRKEKKFWWEEILRKRDEVWTQASPVWGCSLRPARGTTSAAVILISVGTLESWSFECDLRYTLEEKNCLDIFFFNSSTTQHHEFLLAVDHCLFLTCCALSWWVLLLLLCSVA